MNLKVKSEIFSIQAQLVDIVQTAINANFTTLVAAIQAADLVTALKGTGPFTVFAPNNAAFDKLPAGTLANLLKPENKGQLTRILLYHVIGNSNITSTQILSMNLPTNVPTLTNDTVRVNKNGNSVTVNNANVIQVDVFASNGVIHVIDTVLMPPEPAPKPSSATYIYGNQVLFFTFVFMILFSSLCF